MQNLMQSKRKTLFIHAGAHKTGSTAIQLFFHRNTDAIERITNFYLPKKNFKRNDLFYHNINNILYSTENLLLFLDELKEHKDKNFFISDENLFNINKDHIEDIKKILPNHNVKIIFYIRRYDNYLSSLYNQSLKKGQRWTPPFINYKDFLNKFLHADRFSFEKRIKVYASAVGIENIIFRIYDRELLKNNDVVDDILDILDIHIADDKVSKPHDVNLKMPDEILPILSIISHPLKKDNYSDESWKIFNNASDALKNSFYVLSKSADIDLHKKDIEKAIDEIDVYFPGYKEYCSKFSLDLREKENKIPEESLYLFSLIFSFWLDINKKISSIGNISKVEKLLELYKPMLSNPFCNTQANIVSQLKKENKELRKEISQLKIKKSPFQTIKNLTFQLFIKKSAFALVNTNQLDRAESIAQNIIANNPYMAWAYYILSKVHWARAEHTEALKSIDKAIALEPKTEYFQVFKSSCLKKLNKKK